MLGSQPPRRRPYAAAANVRGIMQLRVQPAPLVFLRRSMGGATPARGNEDEIIGFGGKQYGSLQNQCFQFVHAGPPLKFAMSVGGRVTPEVCQVDAGQIHLGAMATVTSGFAPAVSAHFNGPSQGVEHAGGAPRVVEEGIVGRIQPLPASPAPLSWSEQSNAETPAVPPGSVRTQPPARVGRTE